MHYICDFSVCPLTLQNVAGLACLRELRKLCVFAASSRASRASDEHSLTNADFGCLAAALLHLTHLAIGMGAGAPHLTGAALRSLGQHCNQLHTLDIDDTWDDTCWHESNVVPLFLQLMKLVLWRVSLEKTGADATG